MPTDPQQVATIFAELHAQLKGITQTLHKSQERLTTLETPRENRNKHEKRGPLTYQNDWYLTSTQLDVPTFVGHLDYSGHFDPKNFIDRLQSMDKYFTWYPFSEAEKVRFATMKLTEQASQYWTGVETLKKTWFQRPI